MKHTIGTRSTFLNVPLFINIVQGNV